MKSINFSWLGSAALLTVGAITGCNTGQPADTSTYPTSPPMAKPQPTTMPMSSEDMSKSSPVKVPADAEDLSHGDYPPPAFPAPSKPGLIMVVDLDGDPTTAVASTAVTGKDAGKMMSITDVANMSITMNKLHKYRIVFVPTSPSNTP